MSKNFKIVKNCQNCQKLSKCQVMFPHHSNQIWAKFPKSGKLDKSKNNYNVVKLVVNTPQQPCQSWLNSVDASSSGQLFRRDIKKCFHVIAIFDYPKYDFHFYQTLLIAPTGAVVVLIHRTAQHRDNYHF